MREREWIAMKEDEEDPMDEERDEEKSKTKYSAGGTKSKLGGMKERDEDEKSNTANFIPNWSASISLSYPESRARNIPSSLRR